MYWYIFKYNTSIKYYYSKIKTQNIYQLSCKNKIKIIIIKSISLETIYFCKYRKCSINFMNRGSKDES